MNRPSYEEAVQFAADYLKKHGIRAAKPDFLKQLKFTFAARAGYAFFDEDGNRHPEVEDEGRSASELLEALEAPSENYDGPHYRFAFTGERTDVLEWLIEISEHSSIAFEALLLIAGSMARQGLPYAGTMREWVSNYLDGKITKTARTGHIRAETLYRDLLIVGAVSELCELGIAATRNDASPPTSACDAVAEACVRIGVAPGSYQSIKRIWNNSERVLQYF
jgi:hypothetical protein